MIRVDGKEVDVTYFPDGTFKFDFDNQKVVERTVLNIGSGRPVVKVEVPHYEVIWNYENMNELFILQSLNYFLGSKTWSLTMPYLPNARMDKTADENEGFMLKYFANEINKLQFDLVLVDDPHSPVAAQLIPNLIEREKELINYLLGVLEKEQPDLIVFPDKGAKDRYTQLPVFDGYNIAYGHKVRNQKTGEILSFNLLGSIEPDTKALIVDDICSKGGTFYYTAKELNKHGITDIILSVTHLESSVVQGKLLEHNSPIKGIHFKNRIGEGW